MSVRRIIQQQSRCAHQWVDITVSNDLGLKHWLCPLCGYQETGLAPIGVGVRVSEGEKVWREAMDRVGITGEEKEFLIEFLKNPGFRETVVKATARRKIRLDDLE